MKFTEKFQNLIISTVKIVFFSVHLTMKIVFNCISVTFTIDFLSFLQIFLYRHKQNINKNVKTHCFLFNFFLWSEFSEQIAQQPAIRVFYLFFFCCCHDVCSMLGGFLKPTISVSHCGSHFLYAGLFCFSR